MKKLISIFLVLGCMSGLFGCSANNADKNVQVFETENIAHITFYSLPTGGAGGEVPIEYLEEITTWLSSYTIDEKVEDDVLAPGSNSISIEIEYDDGTIVKNGLDTIEIDGITYYMKREDAPECFYKILEKEDLSISETSSGAPLAPTETDLDLVSISHIEVMSGLTGQKITVKDSDSVQKVMDDIESLTYKKMDTVEEIEFAYRIRFYNENYDELGRIFITEENGHQISYDGYYYLIEADLNINVDYLEELLKDAPPAEPGDDGRN